MRCLLHGHRPVEVGASPDMTKCRAANQPSLMPGQAVVVCGDCGKELHVGSFDSYLALLPDNSELQLIH